MELYNTLKTTKSISKNDFAEMMQNMFEYTHTYTEELQNIDSTTYTRISHIIFESDQEKIKQLHQPKKKMRQNSSLLYN